MKRKRKRKTCNSQPMKTWITNYLEAQKRAVDSIPADAVARIIEVVRRAVVEKRQIACIGNGGSASNSSHFTTDLGKCSAEAIGQPIRVLSLTDNFSWITAIGNDYAYEDIYVRQLASYGQPGDLLIGVSVSGNSPNIVKAFEWANTNGLTTVALVGGKRGRLAELAQECVVIEDTHYGRVEDAQMHILHMLCYAFVENPELAKA